MILSPSPRAINWSPALPLAAMTFSGTWVKCDLRAVLGGQGKGKSLGVCRGFRALDIPRRSWAGRRGQFGEAVPQAVRPRARARSGVRAFS